MWNTIYKLEVVKQKEEILFIMVACSTPSVEVARQLPVYI